MQATACSLGRVGGFGVKTAVDGGDGHGIFWLRAACMAWVKHAWAATSWAGAVRMVGMGYLLFGVDGKAA